MPKPTQELVNDEAASIWASGQSVTYSAVRERLHCRRSELVPFMQNILTDPRQKRKGADGISQAMERLRQMIAEEQKTLWAEQVAELVSENEELFAKLTSKQTALETAEARIADLGAQLAAAKTEAEVTRSTAETQTAPLLQVVSGVIAQQTERAEIAELRMRLSELEAARPTAPEIKACSRWTAV